MDFVNTVVFWRLTTEAEQDFRLTLCHDDRLSL
jgi:hypothetical protein